MIYLEMNNLANFGRSCVVSHRGSSARRDRSVVWIIAALAMVASSEAQLPKKAPPSRPPAATAAASKAVDASQSAKPSAQVFSDADQLIRAGRYRDANDYFRAAVRLNPLSAGGLDG